MAASDTSAGRSSRSALGITVGLIGWFVLVEAVSGFLQGYYVPLFSDIARRLDIHDADVNWLEAAQLLLSALVVPILAKLGDMYGHKRMLLLSSVLTAGASWWLVFADSFWVFLLAWALQGFYVVWLPLEVALIFDRGRRRHHGVATTRRAAGLLVVGLEAGAIIGALAAGRVYAATGEDLGATLAVPAVAVTVACLVIWLLVPEEKGPRPARRLDTGGFAILAVGLLTLTGGLTFLRLNGPAFVPVWLLLVAGAAMLVWFARFELGRPDPAIDVRVLRRPDMWPVQATAFLIGISLLGAQGPLSTYAGTDPALGYGLGLDAAGRSNVIGIYLVSLIVGAVLFALTSRRLGARTSLLAASALVALGYALFLPFHSDLVQVLVNLGIAGLGSGALVAALPAAAAAAAPLGQTGVASGLTNTTKTIGGTFSSAVFGVVLAAGTGSLAGTAASLSGYLAVWAVCALGGLLAVVLLLCVPRSAFDAGDVAGVEAAVR